MRKTKHIIGLITLGLALTAGVAGCKNKEGKGSKAPPSGVRFS